MKKFFIVFSLVGLTCVGCQKKEPIEPKEPKPVVAPPHVSLSESDVLTAPTGPRGPSFTERADVALRNLKTRVVGSETKDAFSRQRAEWQLDADNLKAELEKNGRIVREKATTARESTAMTGDNAQIVTVVKSKLVADPEIFASKIQVGADQGVVSLTGSAGSADLVGRAIQLALDTEGVNRVVSSLTIDAK